MTTLIPDPAIRSFMKLLSEKENSQYRDCTAQIPCPFFLYLNPLPLNLPLCISHRHRNRPKTSVWPNSRKNLLHHEHKLLINDFRHGIQMKGGSCERECNKVTGELFALLNENCISWRFSCPRGNEFERKKQTAYKIYRFPSHQQNWSFVSPRQWNTLMVLFFKFNQGLIK